MATWHKRARLVVALFGIVFAVIVYAAMRERPTAAPASPVTRMDPKSVLEMYSSMFDRFTESTKNFEITWERSQTYADGSTKQFGVAIVVHKAENRTFKVTAAQAETGKDQVEIALEGSVRLEDSDGFFLTADAATYNRKESIASAPGAVRFGKGRMSGSGVGMTYDHANDVLTVADQARVATTDDAGGTTMDFSAGTATLDRIRHVLELEKAVHALRGEQLIDTDHGVARLNDKDEVITFIELRGNSRVAGGDASIDAMSARDIDLDYTDDGQKLEAVALTGAAAIAMAAGEAGTGRQIMGEMIRLDLAADGSITRAMASGDVRLDLPAAASAPPRSIRAQVLEGTGEPGKGLTNTTFERDVLFTEQMKAGETARTARAQRLEAALTNDVVSKASFTGDVSFEEAGLKACASRIDYEPDQGTLALSGATTGGNPIVAEEQIAIEAQSIEVALADRHMVAKGLVTTQLRAATRCSPAAARPSPEQRSNRLPGLLKQDAAATVTAGALDYAGASGTAVYTGRALLSQGDTSIRADTVTIDQSTGDLTAIGNAISTMMMDGEVSTGYAHEVRYVDAKRLIRYAAPPPATVIPVPAPPPGPVPGRGAAPAREPYVSGPQGDVRAEGRIEIILAEGGGKAERIAAYNNVRLNQGLRRATGGAQLTYYPDEQKYVMTGAAPAPVVLVAECREFRGKSLTFYKSTDRIIIDGEEERRTETTRSSGPCAAAPAPR
jgi:LPS export ABC transporter protein LptC